MGRFYRAASQRQKAGAESKCVRAKKGKGQNYTVFTIAGPALSTASEPLKLYLEKPHGNAKKGSGISENCRKKFSVSCEKALQTLLGVNIDQPTQRCGIESFTGRLP